MHFLINAAGETGYAYANHEIEPLSYTGSINQPKCNKNFYNRTKTIESLKYNLG